jgi:hypothetical protein
MDVETSDNLIEIRDPEIDVDEIMRVIRERIQRRRKEMGYPRKDFPTFGAAAFPGEPEAENYDEDLYYHLRKANDVYSELDVSLMLSSSPTTRMPVLGRLWENVRKEAHNLVLFYLGKFAGKQVTVNRHLVSTLNRMALQLQQQQVQIRNLTQEIEQLREKN